VRVYSLYARTLSELGARGAQAHKIILPSLNIIVSCSACTFVQYGIVFVCCDHFVIQFSGVHAAPSFSCELSLRQ
jgi:hypothetical protein